MVKKEHLKDIDFRLREERQKEHLTEFKDWYIKLSNISQNQPYNSLLQGQLTMISCVLWYLLPAKDYKKLVTDKHLPQ